MPHKFLNMGTWEDGQKNNIRGMSDFTGQRSPEEYEITWNMSADFGYGFIKMIRFDSGIFLTLQQLNFNQRTKATCCSNDGFIGFHFCLSGSESLKVKGVKNNIKLNQGTNGVFIAKNGCDLQVDISEKSGLSIITMGMTPESFRQAVYAETERLPSVFAPICKEKMPEFKNLSFPATPRMQWVLNQILHPALSSARRKVFFEAKALELIDLVLESLAPAKPTNPLQGLQGRFQSTEIDRIYYAREVLEKNLANPPTIFKLAKIAGMNHCKLNRGFKILFGTTTFGCLRDMRLEKARQLLSTGEMNVTEASNFVGYSCLSHFSKAFKARFYVNPGHYHKRYPSDETLLNNGHTRPTCPDKN